MSNKFDDELFKNGIIPVVGDITSDTASDIISKLLILSAGAPEQPIRLYFSSASDNYTDLMSIYDVMVSLPNPLVGYAIGLVGGYVSLLLAACSKGKRYILKHSFVDFSQPSVVLKPRSQQTEVLIEAKEAREQRKAVEAAFILHTGQSEEKIHNAIEEEKRLTAEEAKEFGLVDKII